MKIKEDGNGNPFIEWEQREGIYKRAWIQYRSGEADWAASYEGKYLNVVRCQASGRPGGNPTDFPIFCELPDKQLLLAFVHSVNAITGCKAPNTEE